MAELVPIDHDPFGQQQPAAGPAPQPTLAPVEHDPFEPAGVAGDLGRSATTGFTKGVASALGSAGDLREAIDRLDLPPAVRSVVLAAIPLQLRPAVALGPGAARLKEAMDRWSESLGTRDWTTHKPQTQAGRYVETAASFVPMALPGSVSTTLPRLAKFALAPGLASEAAGQATEGTAGEPIARAAAAVAAGGGAALLTRPRTAAQAIRREIPENVPPEVVDQAGILMEAGRRRGVPITWAEAIEQAQPGAGQGLLNVQRIAESARDTRGELGQLFAQRPGQVAQAARSEFDNVAAPVGRPLAELGETTRRAATAEVHDVRKAINAAAEPHYTAAELVTVTGTEMAKIKKLPGYSDARAAVLTNPQLNRYVAGLQENQVGFLNEVKKVLDQQGRNAGRVGPEQNQQIAAGLSRDASAVRDTARRASPDYDMALGLEQFGREHILGPLMRSPLGQLAKKDLTTRRAIEVLFPKTPVAGGEQEVAQAVNALARRSPRTAQELVRTHLETTFNNATRELKAGAPQSGGAKFVSQLVGDPQQRKNLQAAVEALPGGKDTWRGFEEFLEIASATGKRQDIGSRTAFNAADLKDLGTGKVATESAKAALSPQRLLTGLGDAWSRWSVGRNIGELAHILTDPKSAKMLRAIVAYPRASEQRLIMAGRLASVYLSEKARQRAQAGEQDGDQERRSGPEGARDVRVRRPSPS